MKVAIGIAIFIIAVATALYFIPIYSKTTQSCSDKSVRYSILSNGSEYSVNTKIDEIDKENATQDCDPRTVTVGLYVF